MHEPDRKDPLVRRILGMTEAEHARFDDAEVSGLVELAPVALPEDPKGDNNHLGWPVATKCGASIVVIHRRIPGHNPRGAGSGDADSTFAMATRSIDGGKTWSESTDLRGSMAPEDRNRGGELPLSHRYKFGPVNPSLQGYKLHLNALGTSASGEVHLLCNYGAFRSTDGGASWTHFPRALREDTYAGDIVYLGPRIVDHPRLGLLAFGNTVGYGESDRFPNPVRGPVDHAHHRLVALVSTDRGESWRPVPLDLPEWAGQHEPAAMLHEDTVLVVGRDQRTGTDHLQMRFDDLTGPVATVRTNMRNSRFIDTVDLDFNPVTRRLEVVRSRREAMRLELWSLDPTEWDRAEWRLEGTLLERTGDFYRTADGFHPAGAVIDPRGGVQHIFIYTGHPNGPAGSFRLTRTLDTPALAGFLRRD